MDNSAFPSQGSVSSISISNQSLNQNSCTGSTSNSEFVNQGLLWWNRTRIKWTGSKRYQKQRTKQEPVLSWDAAYETLLGNNRRFHKPIPLSEMVELLVDIWEQEGMHD